MPINPAADLYFRNDFMHSEITLAEEKLSAFTVTVKFISYLYISTPFKFNRKTNTFWEAKNLGNNLH